MEEVDSFLRCACSVTLKELPKKLGRISRMSSVEYDREFRTARSLGLRRSGKVVSSLGNLQGLVKVFGGLGEVGKRPFGHSLQISLSHGQPF